MVSGRGNNEISASITGFANEGVDRGLMVHETTCVGLVLEQTSDKNKQSAFSQTQKSRLSD